MKQYESYEVLTGLSIGKKFYSDINPLRNPVYRPGHINGNSDQQIPNDFFKRMGYSSLKQNSIADFQTLRNQVFISYSHKDKTWLQRLQVHLKPLERSMTITRWGDTMIKPGSEWREQIRRAIRSCKVAVLLVSANFLASDFITNDELPPLLDAAKAGGIVVLSLIISPCRFEDTDSLSKFQAINSTTRSLASLGRTRQEEMFVTAVKEIESGLSS
ncbi:MAG TPA: toll/interleukin-1 receptor domain-containing protein [Candidatus Nitrosocosmicus sp.]